jgi:hypothetical protein
VEIKIEEQLELSSEDIVELDRIRRNRTGGFEQNQVLMAIRYQFHETYKDVYVPVISDFLTKKGTLPLQNWYEQAYRFVAFTFAATSRHQIAVFIALDKEKHIVSLYNSLPQSIHKEKLAELKRLLGDDESKYEIQVVSSPYKSQKDDWSCGVFTVAHLWYARTSILYGKDELPVDDLAKKYYQFYKIQMQKEASGLAAEEHNEMLKRFVLEVLEENRAQNQFYQNIKYEPCDIFKPLSDYLQNALWGNLNRQSHPSDNSQRKNESNYEDRTQSLLIALQEYKKISTGYTLVLIDESPIDGEIVANKIYLYLIGDEIECAVINNLDEAIKRIKISADDLGDIFDQIKKELLNLTNKKLSSPNEKALFNYLSTIGYSNNKDEMGQLILHIAYLYSQLELNEFKDTIARFVKTIQLGFHIDAAKKGFYNDILLLIASEIDFEISNIAVSYEQELIKRIGSLGEKDSDEIKRLTKENKKNIIDAQQRFLNKILSVLLSKNSADIIVKECLTDLQCEGYYNDRHHAIYYKNQALSNHILVTHLIKTTSDRIQSNKNDLKSQQKRKKGEKREREAIREDKIVNVKKIISDAKVEDISQELYFNLADNIFAYRYLEKYVDENFFVGVDECEKNKCLTEISAAKTHIQWPHKFYIGNNILAFCKKAVAAITDFNLLMKVLLLLEKNDRFGFILFCIEKQNFNLQLSHIIVILQKLVLPQNDLLNFAITQHRKINDLDALSKIISFMTENEIILVLDLFQDKITHAKHLVSVLKHVKNKLSVIYAHENLITDINAFTSILNAIPSVSDQLIFAINYNKMINNCDDLFAALSDMPSNLRVEFIHSLKHLQMDMGVLSNLLKNYITILDHEKFIEPYEEDIKDIDDLLLLLSNYNIERSYALIEKCQYLIEPGRLSLVLPYILYFDRLEIVTRHVNKIDGVEELSKILALLDIDEYKIVIKAYEDSTPNIDSSFKEYQSKILTIDDIISLICLVPNDKKLIIATMFPDKIKNAEDAGRIINVLEGENKWLFCDSASWIKALQNVDDLCQILRVLPEEHRLTLAEKNKALIKTLKDLMDVLLLLKVQDRLSLVEQHISKIHKSTDLLKVGALLSNMDHIKFFKLFSFREFLKMMSNDEEITDNYIFDICIFLDDMPDEEALPFACMLQFRINTAKQLCYVLNKLPHDDRLAFVKMNYNKIKTIKQLVNILKALPRHEDSSFVKFLSDENILPMLPSIYINETVSIDLLRKTVLLGKYSFSRYCTQILNNDDESGLLQVMWLLSIPSFANKLKEKALINLGASNKALAKFIIQTPHLFQKIERRIDELGGEKSGIAKYLVKHSIHHISDSGLYNLGLMHSKARERILRSDRALEKLSEQDVEVLMLKK